MIGEQIQINQDGTATVACKVPAQWIPLLKLIAASRDAVVNDLLKMCLHFIIETAKITTSPSPEMRALLNMMRVDANWASMFNYVNNGKFDVAQAILVLQQSKDGKPCEGYGLALFNKPFMGCDFQTDSKEDDGYMTFSKDEILERVVEVSMKGLYRELRDIGLALGTQSMRETLTMLCDAQKLVELDNSLRDELPQLGNFSDFGRAIEWGQRTKQKKHRTPDSLANSQQRIVFTDEDRQMADEEVKRDTPTDPDDMEKDMGFKPFDQEW